MQKYDWLNNGWELEREDDHLLVFTHPQFGVLTFSTSATMEDISLSIAEREEKVNALKTTTLAGK